MYEDKYLCPECGKDYCICHLNGQTFSNPMWNRKVIIVNHTLDEWGLTV